MPEHFIPQVVVFFILIAPAWFVADCTLKWVDPNCPLSISFVVGAITAELVTLVMWYFVYS